MGRLTFGLLVVASILYFVYLRVSEEELPKVVDETFEKRWREEDDQINNSGQNPPAAGEDSPMHPRAEEAASAASDKAATTSDKEKLEWAARVNEHSILRRHRQEERRKEVRGTVREGHLHGDLVGRYLNGTPGWAPTPYPPAHEESHAMKVKAHEPNCFNLYRSDSLPLSRPLPEARNSACRNIVYNIKRMPATSVIFVFYNEPLSTLYRSIQTVFDRSPPELLHEVILVDDGSSAPWLGPQLDEYVTLLPKTKLVRLPQRSGLMEARSAGARAATGETLTFLDSHIECNAGWLEPLMSRIAEDRRHVVMPIIDSIGADDFGYQLGGIAVLGFTWSLGQTGIYSRSFSTSSAQPAPSPIMAGGLFSIDRELFFDLGAYDSEMKEYGGEEMDISFRIWQCGNTLECIPCSRVGHIFRSKEFWVGQAYPVDGKNVIRNKLRTAEVWMDEYKRLPQLALAPMTAEELGPLDNLFQLRERLKCRSFGWYLENVYPELEVPFGPNARTGQFRNALQSACLDTLGGINSHDAIGVYPCHGQRGTQEFVLTEQNQIKIAVSGYARCLFASGVQVTQNHCGGETPFIWHHDPTHGWLKSSLGKCLQLIETPHPLSPFSLDLRPCAQIEAQRWFIERV